MHKNSLKRMQWFKDSFIGDVSGLHILDVGSMDVNGSYYDIFKESIYTGVDIESGNNVDIVLDNPYNWKNLAIDSFDVVISGQAFEHTEFFWITISEMVRVLKKGGLLCIIAPQGFAEHRYPVDCYRFFTDGMVAMARYVNLNILHAHTNLSPVGENWFSKNSADSMLVARKEYSGKTKIIDLENYVCNVSNHESISYGLVPYKKTLIDKLKSVIWKLKIKLKK